MFPALREELVDEVCALNVRGETDGAVARGESPAQVECDSGGVTRRGMTGGIIYFSSLNTHLVLRQTPYCLIASVSFLERPQFPIRLEQPGNVSTSR